MIQKRIVVGGGGGADGVFVYFADGENNFYSRADILDGFDSDDDDNWSISFAISDGSTNSSATPLYNNSEGLFLPTDTTVTDYSQSNAIIPIIRGGDVVNTMGTYVEEITCVNGVGIVQFYKVG